METVFIDFEEKPSSTAVPSTSWTQVGVWFYFVRKCIYVNVTPAQASHLSSITTLHLTLPIKKILKRFLCASFKNVAQRI